jgi:hypothetical protein
MSDKFQVHRETTLSEIVGQWVSEAFKAVAQLNVSPNAKVLLMYYLGESEEKAHSRTLSLRNVAEVLGIPKSTIHRAKHELEGAFIIECSDIADGRLPEHIFIGDFMSHLRGSSQAEVSHLRGPSQKKVSHLHGPQNSLRGGDSLARGLNSILNLSSKVTKTQETTSEDKSSSVGTRITGPHEEDDSIWADDPGPPKSSHTLWAAMDTVVENRQHSTGPPFKLTPPKPKRIRVSRAAQGKDKIPSWAFDDMYRICFAADTPQKVAVLSKTVKGRVASVLARMTDNKLDLSRLKHFEVWWANSFYSKTKGSDAFTPPTPERVIDLWWVAMSDVDKSQKSRVVPSEVIDEVALQAVMMSRAAAQRGGQT